MPNQKLKPATLAEIRAGQAALARKHPSAGKPKKGGKGRNKEVTPEVTIDGPVEGNEVQADRPVVMETTIEDFNDVKEMVEDNDSLNDILGG